ncbi:hypothetical protein HQQ80_07845 [Microbacteriaceae bacterium VKM Ac-2855]|nr:hypothetical protein [Microbacteriaceae bacterium VKM Ac-2855]
MNVNDYPSLERLDTVGARIMDLVEEDLKIAKKRRNVVTLVGVVGVGALLAAGAAILTPQQTVDTGARCYAAADLDSASGEVSLIDQDADGVPQLTGQAIESCAEVWRTGLLEPDRPAALERAAAGYVFPVPPLTACRQGDGLAIVVPNFDETNDAELCRSLGLTPAV